MKFHIIQRQVLKQEYRRVTCIFSSTPRCRVKPFSPISCQTYSNSLHKVAHTRPITLTKASISQSSPFPRILPFFYTLSFPPFPSLSSMSHARSLARTYMSVTSRSRRLMNLKVEAQKLPIPRLIPFSVVARFRA